jgi:deoxyadenosine/deoxycytidine kinase
MVRPPANENEVVERSLPVSDVPFLVCVEGNIAAGKSELLSWYNMYNGVTVMKEPITLWTDFRNYNLLDLKYQDRSGKRGHEMSFQVLANLTRYKQLEETYGTMDVRMIERSPQSGTLVFADRARRHGSLSNLNFEIICEFNKILSNGPYRDMVTPDLVVYLDASPEICYRRIRERGRPEEKDLSVYDLRDLHFSHELWLESTHIRCPVLRLKNDGAVGSEIDLMPEINRKILELRDRKKARLEQRVNGVVRTPPAEQ